MDRESVPFKEKVQRPLKKKDNSIPKFLLKTYEMLEVYIQHTHEPIISY